jgi:hypothetical protein
MANILSIKTLQQLWIVLFRIFMEYGMCKQITRRGDHGGHEIVKKMGFFQ